MDLAGLDTNPTEFGIIEGPCKAERAKPSMI